jgi:hypothetical protein
MWKNVVFDNISFYTMKTSLSLYKGRRSKDVDECRL